MTITQRIPPDITETFKYEVLISIRVNGHYKYLRYRNTSRPIISNHGKAYHVIYFFFLNLCFTNSTFLGTPTSLKYDTLV